MVAHTLDVLYNTEKVLATTMHIELGQRGYSLSGNEKFLETYTEASGEIHIYLNNLQRLTSDNPAQQQHILKLKKNIHDLLAFSSTAVSNRKKNLEPARDLNSSLQGKALMDQIRSSIVAMEDEENALLKERNVYSEQQIARFNTYFVSLLALTAVILIVVFYTVVVTLRHRADSEARLQAAADEIRDLYDNAPCGYHSLDADGVFVNVNATLLRWLGYSKEEMLGKKKFLDVISERSRLALQDHNTFEEFKKNGSIYNLEFEFVRKDGSEFPVVLSSVAIRDGNGRYIKSRSTTFDNTERKQAEERVKHLNQELEAFTYSVSHDLRAPLRSIDGYSRILLEDYTEKLDDEGKRVINVIMNNAKRMGKLIDDLLDFARLGRKEVSRSLLNVQGMVKNIVRELMEQEPGRSIDIRIGQLAPANGDIDMIRQVWENLISNAIKYTGKTEHAVIEISSTVTPEEVQYSIRDNGVGFDMQYAHKLFGVFQRLHKLQDFNGTGVGLAIVKRIVDRHHGRVWAEAGVNQGATFYFTIPN